MDREAELKTSEVIREMRLHATQTRKAVGHEYRYRENHAGLVGQDRCSQVIPASRAAKQRGLSQRKSNPNCSESKGVAPMNCCAEKRDSEFNCVIECLIHVGQLRTDCTAG